VSDTLDDLARRALQGMAMFAAEQARAERDHIMLRAKFREYKLQHQRLLVAHKLLKYDYQALKNHYDDLLRQLESEIADSPVDTGVNG